MDADRDWDRFTLPTPPRSCPGEVRVERRGEGDSAGQYLLGYASVFDEWTTLVENKYWVWKETVRKGAFSAAISERQDVRSLFNHDPNFVLGRTASGTLSLKESDKGLLSETRLSDSPTVRDLVVVPIQRGDVSGMSFAFTVRNDGGQMTIEKADGKVIVQRKGERIVEYLDGEQLVTERELLSLNLFDTSPVTYPQYKGTSIGMRSADLEALEREARRLFTESLRSQPRDVAAWNDWAAGIERLSEAG